MATIPIEVIVQDAEAPVVPGEDGTNTNTNTETTASVAVPDTGEGTSNIFTGSASTIVLPVVLLVLALVSIVAILIHKYHKQKNNKTTRKEKLAVATSSTIAVLAATVLVGNLILPATKAATNTDTNSISPAEDKITITIDREEALESSAASTAYATVATSFGYEILLAASSSTANLYLDGDSSSEYYITPTESTELATNTWGYSLEEGGAYEAVPLEDNASLIAKGTETIENEEFNVYYGVKVSEELPAGTYKGEIEYILSDTGFPYALRTMQNMTTEICESAPTPNAFKADGTTIEDIVPTATLKDIRDDKTYTIAKLADGNCWMTQNLDLQKEDLLAGVTLDNSNTDHPATDFVLPDSQISGDESWGGDEAAYNTAHVYDPSYNETKYYYCANFSFGPGCLGYSDEEVPVKEFSNYYNWYAATAGTGTYSLGSGEVAAGSICPSGWKLPNGAINNAATDYSNLFYRYGIMSSPTSTDGINNFSALFERPLLFTQGSGAYYAGLSSVGTSSSFWASMSYGDFYGSNAAWHLGIYPNNILPWSYTSKYGGLSVRCLAQ